MRMWTRAVALGAIGLAAGGAIGCAEERAPINRVQPDALAKSFFVGNDLQSPLDDPEFYAQGTVVDVGYGAGADGLFTSTYGQPLTRIKWQIWEKLLIGRETYQRIQGADGKGNGAAADDGQVAYVYPITSQFDIERDYNPSTGEQDNVIVENTSDRGWEQREYMRVDWSQNLAKDGYDFDTLSLLNLYGGVTYEPISYYVNDANDPDAPHFNPQAGYFDVTNKAFAQPGEIDLSGLGWGINKFPSCMLENDFFGGSAPAGNCNPVEITLRQAFRRVEVSDYEPVDYDGVRFDAFGIFTTERHGYSRDYGMTDQDWHRFASRYNIWEKSHAYTPIAKNTCPAGWQQSKDFPTDCEVACNTPTTVEYGSDPNADANDDGTADACAAVTEKLGAGSQCDSFKQKCTAPYESRKAVPIVWHVAKNSNPTFFEGTQWAAQEWDVGMRLAVQAAKYAECNRVNNTQNSPDCLANFPIYQGQQDENQDAVALATEVDTCRNVAGKKEAECEALADSIGGQRNYSAGVIAIAKLPEMLVLCHTPVEKTDSPLCAEDIKKKDPIDGDTRAVLPANITAADCDAAWYPVNPAAPVDAAIKATCDNGFIARQGDMRFHQVNLIKEAQTPSPWGIMVDSDDPLTGEKVAASINVWTHVNDLASQSAVDLMRYIKGELQTADITDGKYVQDWAAAAQAAGGKGALGTMSKATIDKRILASADGRSLQNGTPTVQEIPTFSPELQAKINAFAHTDYTKGGAAGLRASPDVHDYSESFVNARRQGALYSATEASILTPAMQQLTTEDQTAIESVAPASAKGLTEIEASASLLRNMNPAIQRTFRMAKERALADRGACIINDDEATAPAPNALTGLADVLERKFQDQFGGFNTGDQQGRALAMKNYIAQRYQYGVIIHEMGHSIGLRHNFVSSAYAWGYRPQYWQLRTKDGAVKTQCTDASTDGEDCVGPRYFDPTTPNETQNLIWMFMQSSVMDYPGEITQDMNGLGAYDFAAARMFYGDVVSVHNDPSYNAGKLASKVMLSVTNNFGGITGYEYTDGGNKYHYSALQDKLNLIQNCATVNPADFRPSYWDDAKYGTWDPLLDGLIVQQENGTYTRCKQQQVDYVPYRSLRAPKGASELGSASANTLINFNEGVAIDKFNRTRLPYGFASDDWADVGNLSVFRHDNGADAYELFDFFITEQETRHIFDNYRRDRNSFSVKAASTRILERYNEKMRDAAKGVGLYSNIYRDFFASAGYDFDKGAWAGIANVQFHDATIATGIAFDQFTKQLQRPESGEHQVLDGMLRPQDYQFGNGGTTAVIIPDGATGKFGQVSSGGKLLENQLGDSGLFGDYSRDYTLNAGSYYDKVYAPFLLTESVDNFISSAREDFHDARYRNVSMADLFKDGYRRFLANNLTGDDDIKGPRLASLSSTKVDVDSDKFPKSGIGFTSWWTPTPESCFPGPNNIVCTSYGCPEGTICDYTGNLTVGGLHPTNPDAPANTMAIDPEVDWEQQKFLIAQTLLYIPENAKEDWINQMGIWEQGSDNDPQFQNRIELHLPNGKVYIAQTYGTEVIFGKTIQRGVAARILEYANSLVADAYVTTTVVKNGVTWYEPVIDANGNVTVKYDPTIHGFDGTTTCSSSDNSGCTCTANHACMVLEKYEALPAYMRQAMHDFRMADPTMKGIYE